MSTMQEKHTHTHTQRSLVTEKMSTVRGSEYDLQGGDQAMNWALKNG